VSAAIRLYIFFTTTPSSIGAVGVTSSHTDIALGVIRNEELSFNIDRHEWIESKRDSLVDVSISKTPDFSASKRTPITYMDPGYSIMVGLFSKITESVNWRLIQLLQIVLDVFLSWVLYMIGREIGLSKLLSTIAPAVHAVNIFLLRPVFELVQDSAVIFLVIISLWLLIMSPRRKQLNWLRYVLLFLVGGIIPWFRSLFLLYPFFIFISVYALTIVNKIARRFVFIAFVFLAGSIVIYLVPRNVQFMRSDLPFSFGRPGCFWYTFYCGQHQFNDGPTGDELARPTVMRADPGLKERPLITSWNRIDSVFKGIVTTEIKKSPLEYGAKCARRLLIGFFPSFYGNYNNRLTIPPAFLYLAKIVLFLLSSWLIVFFFYYFRRRKDTTSLLLLVPWIYIALVSAPFYLQGRSLMPAIDLMIIFLVFSLAHVWKEKD
jgi:hypothetical protein